MRCIPCYAAPASVECHGPARGRSRHQQCPPRVRVRVRVQQGPPRKGSGGLEEGFVFDSKSENRARAVEAVESVERSVRVRKL